MNDKGVCRTAPATPGMLIITLPKLSLFESYIIYLMFCSHSLKLRHRTSQDILLHKNTAFNNEETQHQNVVFKRLNTHRC